NAQVFERSNLSGNKPKRRAVTVRLLEVVTAEPRGFIHFIGKIQVSPLFKGFPVTRSANFAHHLDGFLTRKRLGANGHDVSMHAHFRWLSLREMQIGAAVFDDYAEKF